ncbi:Rv1355c family protein [Pedobacter insulae]|uniref:ThiF family protein n=1 Tax=Pedobacter insulae TaxID=414048 RepID=A0A1I2UPZ1_9SPHI|nr:Rv1355c family protein [Pedobacter insulae]SFG76841.1 ThiF family protein [Pedobacter insulae]
MQSKSSLALKIAQLVDQTQELKNVCKPLFFKLIHPEQKRAFKLLLQTKENLQVFDHIYSQVEELIKCLQPTIVFSPPSALAKAVENQFQGNSSDEYGVWVYYPWCAKLVHLLDENEFTIVRTNRNKHKITASEQDQLANKKIGVMGLSVGQSVSLTLAMERSFGELRIADFDELDLSNINRIRTGVQNLKIKKTVIVAREIAEIDPFLKVVCFDEGITADNLGEFLEGNGKLDLLIDECDSFDIKINSRKKAKSLGIPVLMEGSDRGTIDIERFDLEPERLVLHGMVEHLDMEKYSTLTTMDEQIPYITAVTGVETLSPRMKGSAIEIMSTISTWPQLASAVTYGGGITADVARKILLGNLSISGRFFLDLDELITDTLKKEEKPAPKSSPLITTKEIQDFITDKAFLSPENSEEIPETMLIALVNDANKAPSGGNNQPWRFHYQNRLLHLFLEESVAQAYLDPAYISSYVSIGAAIENLLLSAANHNLKVNWELTPDLAPRHIAWFSFSSGYEPTNEETHLAAQIEARHTNRKVSAKQIVEPATLLELAKVTSSIKGAQLKWITDPAKIHSLADIAAYTDLLRMFIPEAHADFIHKEMRWSLAEVDQTQDGIGIHTLDLNNNDHVGIRLIKDRRTIDFLQQINGGNGYKRLTLQQFMSSSAIGLITMPKSSSTAMIDGGRAAEKLWLASTGLNLQIHPVNVALLFFYKNSIEQALNIPQDDKADLTQMEQTFNSIFENNEHETAVFMFRLFKASPSPERTIRKSTAKIFSIGRA